MAPTGSRPATFPATTMQQHGMRPSIADVFFNDPTQSALLTGKFVTADSTPLHLPHCGINSFQSFHQYGRTLPHFMSNSIQRIQRTTDATKKSIMTSTQPENTTIFEAMAEVERTVAAQTKKAEELQSEYQKIQGKMTIPTVIDRRLQTDLMRLDTLHAELKTLMEEALQAQTKLHSLIQAQT